MVMSEGKCLLLEETHLSGHVVQVTNHRECMTLLIEEGLVLLREETKA